MKQLNVTQNSSDVGNESNGPSLATEPNLQQFLNTFVCQANANGTKYFYFEVSLLSSMLLDKC
jgi:hypothetical protein